MLWGLLVLQTTRAKADDCDGACPITCGGISRCTIQDGVCYCEADLGTVAGIIIGIVGGLVLLGILVHLCNTRRMEQMQAARNQARANSARTGTPALEGPHEWPPFRDDHNGIFTLKELKQATNQFDDAAVIGSGSHGTVYKAKFAERRMFAVKKIDITNSTSKQRYWQEVKTLMSLEHPNLVPFRGTCNEDGIYALLFDYMGGGSLEDRLGMLTWEESENVALDIAEALVYLHERASPPVIHRDLKTSNVLLDTEYRARLADFGTSCLLHSDQDESPSDLEQGDRAEGTSGYMAPECETTGSIGPKVDVYAFGVVLLELITGVLAFDPTRPPACRNLVDAVSSQARPSSALEVSLNGLSPRLSKWPAEHLDVLCEMAQRCTLADPADRPNSSNVLQTLEQMVTPGQRSSSRLHSLEHASGESTRDCLLCMDRPRLYRCLPCGHNTICELCLSKCQFRDLFSCPICRQSVKAFTIAKTPETYVHWE